MGVPFTTTPTGNLLGWIAPHETGTYIGAFVGEDAAPGASQHFAGRAPATKLCYSVGEARRWIEDQAAAFGLPIKWVGESSPT
jgi:hypothetical protein